MQQKIKLVTLGFIALINRKQGAISSKIYKTAKNAKKALQMHIEKAKQVRKEQIINAILKGASILHTIAKKLEQAKQNLKNFGYSFQRYIIVLKLKKAYNKALHS
jgi:uncharacterized protein YfcZ (UPF0381/DUF406 family)